MIFHEQKKIFLKHQYVFVDKKISPLIKWINLFKSVETYASCQGNKSSQYSQRPYIFFSANKKDLLSIFEKLSLYHYCENLVCHVGFNPQVPQHRPKLLYTMEFSNIQTLDKVINDIRKNYNLS